MDEKIKNAIEEYQCSGCVNGSDSSCYERGYEYECKKHTPGTIIYPIVIILLGMPKGFNRLDEHGKIEFIILKDFKENFYNIFTIPVWKYLDKYNNTLIRGYCPRINKPFINIILGNHIDKINCIEITKEHLNNMD